GEELSEACREASWEQNSAWSLSTQSFTSSSTCSPTPASTPVCICWFILLASLQRIRQPAGHKPLWVQKTLPTAHGEI
ncbi:mCG144808, partial [Mus musculus]